MYGVLPDRKSEFSPPAFSSFSPPGRTIPQRPPFRPRSRVLKTSVACQTDDHPEYPRIPRSPGAATPMASSSDASGSNSDGTLRLLIQNFRNMADTVRGPSKSIQNVPWRIMVMPRQHVVQKKGTQKCLGFFLQCCPEAYSDSWSCQAAAELRLISQKQGVPHFTRKTNHNYTAKENDWGYSCFMTWADILDENQGYIKDDNVILEVSVKAEAPKAILTLEQFGKKIQDYKRLADMQCSRGLIDKAIEVNASALKFCKDKDPERKAELEKQKVKLIEMKLKESIERIEKDTTKTGDEENTANNLNALKQAISASTAKSSRGAHKNHCSTKHKDSKELEKRSKTPPVLPNHAKNKSTTQPSPPTSVPPPPEPVPTPPAPPKTAKAEAKKASEQPPAPPADNTMLIDGQFNNDLLSNVSDNRMHRHPDTLSSGDCDLPEDLQNADIVDIVNQAETRSDNHKDIDQHFLKQYASVFRSDDFLGNSSTPPTPRDIVKTPAFQKKLKHIYDPAKLDETFRNPELRFNGDGDDELSSSEGEHMSSSSDFPPGKKPRRSNDIDIRSMKGYPFYLDDFNDYPVMFTSKDSGCQTDFAPATSQGQTTNVEDSVRLKPTSTPIESKVAGRPFAQPTRKSTRRAVAPKEPVEAKEKIAPIVDIYAGLPLRTKDTPAAKQEPEPPVQEVIKPLMDEDPLLSAKAPIVDSASPMDSGSIASTDSSNSSTSSGSTSQTLAYNLDGNSFNSMRGCPFYSAEMLHSQAFAMNVMPMEFAMDVYHNFTQHFANSVASHADQSDRKNRVAIMDEAMAHKLLNGNLIDDWVKANVKNHKLHQAITAMSIVSINCMNARRIVDKACEFLDSMENAANGEEIRSAINCLALLANDGVAQSVETTPESSPERETPQSAAFADDTSDYSLTHEEKRIDECITVAKRYQQVFLHSDAAMIRRNVDKLVQKVKTLTTELQGVKNELMTEKAHFIRNEDKHGKTLKALQAQLAQERDKNEKSMQALKERKNEIKKLEKKAKAEAQLTVELAAAKESLDSLSKENGQLQKKLNEEQLKYKRDTQSLSDSKKHIQTELNSRNDEMKSLSSQVDEKTQALRKAESLLANERKQNQSAVTAAVERGKKAEIGLLEHKLEVGLQILERARDDCQKNVRELEETLKRVRSPTDIEVVKKSIGDWVAKKEEIIQLISNTKTEFQTHIASIKSGKLLSQLPKITVPKPPPSAPRIQIVVPQNSPADKHTSPSAPGVIGSRPISQASMKSTDGIPSASGSGLPNDVPGSPIPKGTPSGFKNSQPPICLTPIGVRPSGYVNGTSASTPQRPQSTTNIAPSPGSPSQMLSGQQNSTNSISPWPWSDPLQNYTESLLSNSNRTFRPIGAEYSNSRSLSMEQPSSSYTSATAGAPGAPGTPASSQMIGRSRNGWDGSRPAEWSVADGAPPMHNGTVPNHYGDVPGGTYGGRWSNSTWQGYSTPEASQASDSRSGSPLLRPNVTELREEFFNHMNYLLPGASHQLLVEYFDRFLEKVKLYCAKNQADMIAVMVEALTRSISLILLENPEILGPLRNTDTKNPASSASTSAAMSSLYDVFVHTLSRFSGCPSRKAPRGDQEMVCGFCVHQITPQQPHRTLKCAHLLHEKCFKDWSAKKQFCAICGKRTSDDYPELAK
ncbi:hypothetical protein L596_003616 [Steinernema carpocapsae]|uniref:MATH domain-containing protein n=1 Tax=Steinernema carpocapsae TaxID=34508 RepID=A0A4U8UT97_STECR|nr:hypothetical protein L596_003616 [Steinernema carpocapsae]